jgi:hypothetical protein
LPAVFDWRIALDNDSILAMKIKLERIPIGPDFKNMLDVTSCTMSRDEFIERYGWDAMPKGPYEEYDGSVWRIIEAENPELEGRKWRWQPLNWTAFGKGEPTGELRGPPMGFQRALD